MSQALIGIKAFCTDVIYKEDAAAYRVGRTILFIALAALALTIPTGNPLQLLRTSPYAFGATLLTVSLFMGYQFSATRTPSEQDNDDGIIKSVFWTSDAGICRIIRTVGMLAIGVAVLSILNYFITNSWNPIELLKNKYAFGATLIAGGLVVGYQAGRFGHETTKVKEIARSFSEFLQNLCGEKDGWYQVARTVLLLGMLTLSLSISSHFINKSYNPLTLLKSNPAALGVSSLIAGLIIAYPAKDLIFQVKEAIEAGAAGIP